MVSERKKNNRIGTLPSQEEEGTCLDEGPENLFCCLAINWLVFFDRATIVWMTALRTNIIFEQILLILCFSVFTSLQV